MLNFFNNMMFYYPTILHWIMMFILMLPSKNMKIHPMNYTIILIIYTMIMSLLINFMLNSWIPFFLFLIIIGGLMVMFMYISSLTNNELMSFNKNNLINLIMKIIFLSMMFMLLQKFYLNNNLEFQNMNFQNNLYFTNIYNNKFIIFMLMYLLYSLICIMNICYKLKIPLRQKLNYE